MKKVMRLNQTANGFLFLLCILTPLLIAPVIFITRIYAPYLYQKNVQKFSDNPKTFTTLETVPCTPDQYESKTDYTVVGEKKVNDQITKDKIYVALANYKDVISGYNFETHLSTNYHPGLNNLTYIKLASKKESETLMQVILLNLETKEEKVVYEHQRKLAQKSDFHPDFDIYDSLSAVSFSDDGTKLFITASSKFVLYDIANSTSEIVHTIPIYESSHKGSHNFLDPLISPNKEYVLLTVPLYEGSGTALFRINTKELVYLDFFSYTSGKEALAWSTDNKIIAHQFVDSNNKASSAVFYVDPTNLKESKPFWEINGSTFSTYVFKGVQSNTNIYGSINRNEKRKTCDRAGKSISVTQHSTQFGKISMEDESFIPLYTNDNVDGLSYPRTGAYTDPATNVEHFLVQLTNQASKEKVIYEFSEDNPNKFTKLILE